MNTHYLAVAMRAFWRCEYCHAPEEIFNIAFEVEHIHPRALQGSDLLSNLALACSACNLFKAAAIAGLDPQTQQLEALFNPRLQDWAEHFEAEATSGEILGRTPTGRATVERLRMNRALTLRARRHWIALGLFP